MCNFKVVAVGSKQCIHFRDLFDPDHICKEKVLKQLISSATLIGSSC